MTTTSTGDGEFSAVVGSYSITDDIVIAHDVTYDDHVSITGTLTVDAGKTFGEGAASKNLTVSGDVTVNGTLDLDRSSSDGNATFGSLTINSGGTVQAPSHGNITLTSETSGGYTWRNNGGTFTHNNGTVTTNSSVDTKIRENTFYNLIINQSSSGKFVYWEDTSGNTCTVANDLTITTGRLRGLVASDTVTVTGDVLVDANGTFNHTSVWTGSINHGSLTINSGGTYLATSGTTTLTSYNSSNNILRVTSGGTFTHNNGTVKVTTNSSGKYFRVDNVTFYNVQISNNDTGAYVRWRGTPCTISNDLTIDANSKFKPHGETQVLNITGDVNLSGTNSFLDGNDPNNDISTEDWSFGSLTIASGATYRATSGTTTINGDPGGYPNLGINLDGTFTHNNGTLKYTGGSGGLDLKSTGNLYNFEHAPTGTTFITNNTTIENNLTMTGANFQGVNGNENLTVKGNVTINSSGQTMNFNGASEHTFGFLTILDGTYKVQNDTGGFTKVGGIRNVGGTVSNAV